MQEKLITAEDIRSLYRLSSVKTVYLWLKKGALPPPIEYPGHRKLWRESDILDMMKREGKTRGGVK